MSIGNIGLEIKESSSFSSFPPDLALLLGMGYKATSIILTTTYDVRLVTLSVVIAVFGSYIALDLAGQSGVAQGWARKLWLTGATIALGISTWAVHFIGMLAYQLPIPIVYDFTIVFISMAVAIAGAGAGLFVVNGKQPLRWLPLITGAGLVGFSIIALHFTAMAAMRVAAISFYDAKLMVLSAATAIVGSGSALWLSFDSRVETAIAAIGRRIGSAILMGTAIVGMHYIAMAAVSFQQTNQLAVQSSPTHNNARLAVTIGIATLIILMLTLLASFFTQLSKRKQTEKQLFMLERALEQSIDGIAVTDIDGQLLFINPAWAQMHRCCINEVIGQHFSIFHTETQMQQEVLPFMEYLQQAGANTGEIEHKRQDGTTFPTQKTVAVITDGDTKRLGYVAIARDITERKQAEAQLREYAFHDALTSLPNRALFMNRLEYALNQAKRHENYLFAVLFLDLDRFKVINDSLGHSFGDQLLIAIARRLATCLRPTDTPARLGGDEFTILLEGINDIWDAIRIADRIQAELRLPFTLGEQEVFTTASIGIALSSTGYDRPEDLLRDADIAMYRAKDLGKARYEIFNTDMHILAVARLQLENDLRRAIERQEFQIYYQPIVSLKIGKIIGFEALVRWQHPNRGLLNPQDFLAVVQETGLSVTVEQWVLRQACRQMRQWQLAFPSESPMTICVNFCSSQFAQPNLIEQIHQVLQDTGLDAQSLKLEITESVIMENAQFVTDMLFQLKALGIQLAIDDFGTGYSSLGRLHRFPINVLKIDRSFISHTREEVWGEVPPRQFGGVPPVRGEKDSSPDWLVNLPPTGSQNSHTDIGNLEIVGTMVTLAHSLGVDVTVEGVETAEQLARLRELNCEYGQGYFFSLPLDSEATEALIIARPQW